MLNYKEKKKRANDQGVTFSAYFTRKYYYENVEI